MATSTVPVRRRWWIAAAGIVAVAVLYEPLELDDLPRALRGGGATAPVLWAIVAALWIWSVARFERIAAWYGRNRIAVLQTARRLGICWAPIFVGLFYVMWVLGRLSLGHWPPRNMNDDPKGIFACAIVHMIIIGWFWLFPVAVITPHVVRAKLMPERRVLGHVGDFVVTAALVAATVMWWELDTHSLPRWFKD